MPKNNVQKIAKTELITTMVAKTGLTKKQSEDAFNAVIDSVTGALRSGQSVALPGLGTMTVKATAARIGVRPGTSQKIQIPAGKKVSFKVSSTLKDAL